MDQTKELLEMPREFVKDGRQFLGRCSKRMSPPPFYLLHTFAPTFTPLPGETRQRR